MEFRNLKASLKHNSEEPASIYTAVNLIRSLFKDVAEESEQADLSHSPLGNGSNDDRLPSELIWLGNQIVKVYKNNSDSLTNNRARLDNSVKEVENLLAELGDEEQYSIKLEKLSEEKAELEQRLAAARKAQEDQAHAAACCDELRAEIASLASADVSGMTAELESLKNEASALKDRNASLSRSIEEQNAACEAAKDQIAEKERALEDRRRERERLFDALSGAERAVSDEDAEAEALRGRLSEAAARLSSLEEEKRRIASELEAKEAETASLGEDALRPLMEELQAKEAALQEQKEQKAGTERELARLEENASALSGELEALNGRLAEAQAALEKKEEAIAAGEDSLASIKTKLEEADTALSKLDSERERISSELAVKEVEKNSFDEDKLRPLMDELSAKEEALNLLSEQKNDAERELAQLDEKGQSLFAELETLRGHCAEAQDAIDKKADEISIAGSTISLLEGKLANAVSRLSQLDVEKDRLAAELDRKEAAAEAFENESLLPLREQIRSAEDKLAELEAQKEEADRGLLQLGENRTALVTELGRIRSDSAAIRDAITRKTADIADANAEKARTEMKLRSLAEEMNSLSESLDALQTASLAAENEKKPELARMLCAEISRALKCVGSIGAEVENSIPVSEAEVRAMEASIKEADASLCALRSRYTALTEKYNDLNGAIVSLKRQIDAIESDNNEDRHITYKKQLEERLADLKAIGAECERLTQEIDQRNAELAAIENKKHELESVRARKDELLRERRTTEAELAAVDIGRMRADIDAEVDRTRLLKSAADKLRSGIEGLSRAMDPEDAFNKIRGLGEYSSILKKLDSRLDQFQAAIIEYADSIELMEGVR